jgi:uncharacterized protein YcbK (DUF882 family)
MNRRAFLRGGAAACALGAATPALAAGGLYRTRWTGLGQPFLWLRVAGLGEEAHVRFRTNDGRLLEDGVRQLSWTMRDWRDDDAAVWIDYRLFDVLAYVQTAATLETDVPAAVVLNSGYRTPRRNATIEGAARRSQHIFGRAADLAIEDLPHMRVAALAEEAGAAGIGQYRRFTHIDVGREGRRW